MAQTGIETFFAVGGTKSQFEMYKARELRRVQTQLTAQGKEIVNIIEGPITRPLTGWSQDIKVIWKTTEVKPIHTVTTPQAKPTTEKVSVTSDNFNSILERIDLFLEDKNWEKAIAYCESALDFDPKNASVYLKYLLADCKCSTFEELLDSNNAFEKNSYYQKVLRFGDEDFTSNLKESILRSKNQKELNRCNNIYNQAKSLMSNTNPSIDELESAIKLFNDIKHFKDSSEQILFCQNRVTEIAKKESEEQKAREVKDLKKNIKIAEEELAKLTNPIRFYMLLNIIIPILVLAVVSVDQMLSSFTVVLIGVVAIAWCIFGYKYIKNKKELHKEYKTQLEDKINEQKKRLQELEEKLEHAKQTDNEFFRNLV